MDNGKRKCANHINPSYIIFLKFVSSIKRIIILHLKVVFVNIFKFFRRYIIDY